MTGPARLVLVASAVVAGSICASAAAAHGGRGTQDSGSAPHTVSKGAASSEQAARGEAVYLDECGRCHAETLSGTEFGPALVGREFVRSWAGKSVSDMFVRVRDTMPADGAGRLSAQQSVDLVAFILRENKIDVGDQPLAAESAALKKIAIK